MQTSSPGDVSMLAVGTARVLGGGSVWDRDYNGCNSDGSV